MSSIIVPNESSIMGVGAIQRVFRPDDAGQAVLREELGVVLSADHRLHTGVGALHFLEAFERALTEPTYLIQG
jgi:pyruvate dehydrogenase E2 component (dihydrolipoamide acetyltransferase)